MQNWNFLHQQTHPHELYLLQELLLGLLDDDGVGVAHHGNQHVQQEDGDQDLEEDKHGLRHVGVWTSIKIVILQLSSLE